MGAGVLLLEGHASFPLPEGLHFTSPPKTPGSGLAFRYPHHLAKVRVGRSNRLARSSRKRKEPRLRTGLFCFRPQGVEMKTARANPGRLKEARPGTDQKSSARRTSRQSTIL